MTKPTTIRLPEDVLSELDRRAQARGKDRATLLRELLRAALDRDKEDEVVTACVSDRVEPPARGQPQVDRVAQALVIDAGAAVDGAQQRDHLVPDRPAVLAW